MRKFLHRRETENAIDDAKTDFFEYDFPAFTRKDMEFVSSKRHVLSKKQDVIWINPRPPPSASATQAAEAENLKTQSSTSNFDKYGDDLFKGMKKFLHLNETENGIDFFEYDSSIYKEYEEKYKEIISTVEKAAKFAVEKHNKMTGENIILLIAVNANLQLRYDAKVLDMTLKTLDGDQIVYKEAKVSEYFGFNRPIELDIFRNAICYDKIKELESNLGRNADSSTEGSARRQQKCRSENISTQKRAFFNAHKDEEWRNRQAQETAKKFLLYLSKGILDLSPCATAFYSSKPWQNSEPNSYDKAGEKNRRLNKGQDEESEFLAALKAHPVSCLRRRIQSGERVLYGIELLDTLLAHVRPDDKNYGETSESGAKGFRHVRLDGKDYGETIESGAEWEKKLDTFWQKWLCGPHSLEAMICKEKIDAADVEALDLYLEHPELVMEPTSKVCRDLYFHNYMSDPDAPGGTL
ncbi:hypothetical protein FEM48_Zijuj03G0179100 [Ziziphus jujuba var. spinosa]|uniref:Uncharacterized protein n=1 Tax=Ziziphus jujuba var. spinosa TaxID=714518 RepID=A0A978VRS3_ZIZJJ|nr:hypothetical protein FEM48_Zijuj03G0179100 [Ziziphus jujuba var. spinosa]